MSGIEQVVSHIDENFDASVERLFELLRIESVSTDPAYAAECGKAADWLVGQLNGLGFTADARETIGHPMVVAHYTPKNGVGEVPHVLFYGHYDVQPVDPLDLWETPPFEPRRATVDGSDRIIARGAADDKGQLMTFLEAARAWIGVSGDLPLKVTVLLEGEEESGSKSLAPFLEQHGEEVKADLALVCDTAMWNAETPAITTRLRGMYMDEVIVTGPSVDLHSGMYGGVGHNPIHILSGILAALHDEEGRVTVAGFYDGVDPVPEHIGRQWNELPFDEENHLRGIGQTSQAGETGKGVLEKVWARPTCDINGIIGGYTGEGTKTVIPSKASAKVSFRLVGRQDPQKIGAAFREFVRARLPEGCEATFIDHAGSPAIEISPDSPHLTRAAAALETEFGRPAALIGCGGSIPIVGNFKSDLGMDSLLVGFGLDDDRVHSPNEKYNVSSYHHGIRSWARIMDALAS